MKAGWLKVVSALVPYMAVLVGLYVFGNAWAAIGLYHLGITVFLISGDRKALLKEALVGWNSIIAAPEILMSVMIVPIVYFLWGRMELENVPLREAMGNLGLGSSSWIFFMISKT